MSSAEGILVRIVIPLVFVAWIVCILVDLAISDWVFAGAIFALAAAAVVLRRLARNSPS